MNAFRELLSDREGGSTSVTTRSRSSLPRGRSWPATYAPGHEFRASPLLEALKGSLDPAWTQLEQVLREPVVSGQTNESLQLLSLHFPGLSWPLSPLPWEMCLRASPMGAQLSHPTQGPGPGLQPSTPRPSENSSGALWLWGLSLRPEQGGRGCGRSTCGSLAPKRGPSAQGIPVEKSRKPVSPSMDRDPQAA